MGKPVFTEKFTYLIPFHIILSKIIVPGKKIRLFSDE